MRPLEECACDSLEVCHVCPSYGRKLTDCSRRCIAEMMQSEKLCSLDLNERRTNVVGRSNYRVTVSS